MRLSTLWFSLAHFTGTISGINRPLSSSARSTPDPDRPLSPISFSQKFPNFLHQKAGHAAAVETLLALEAAENIDLIRITDTQFAAGKAYFEKYSRLSLVDALTVACMKDLDISRIYSFDSDFDGIEGIIRLTSPSGEKNIVSKRLYRENPWYGCFPHEILPCPIHTLILTGCLTP